MDCMALSKWIRWLYFHGLGGSATMEYSSEGFCLVYKTKIYGYCLMNKTKRRKYCLTDKTICLYNAVKERVLRMNRDILKQIIVDQKEID